MTLSCSKCQSPMTLKSRLSFAVGPGKLIYVCSKSANHVTILEDQGSSEPIPAGD